MSKILQGLEEYWYKILSSNENGYKCILKSQELNEKDLEAIGFPHIKYQILEVDEVAEGILKTNSKKDVDFITETFTLNSRYLLDFDLYFKSDKHCDIDDLKFLIANKLLMSRKSQNYDYTDKGFKKLILRDSLGERPINDIFQDQTISRYNYQQPFIVEITRTNDIEIAKEATITENEF